MRVAVLGASGTGGFFGGLLARAGEDVVFVARGAHLEALRQRGLVVRSHAAGEFTLPVQATDRTECLGLADLVLVCVKTYDTEAALHLLPPLVGPHTVIFSVQNGVDNAEIIGRAVGAEHVLGAVAYVSAVREFPGVVRHLGGPGKLVLGELSGGASPRLEQLRAALERAGIPVEVSPNVPVAIWQKFLFICAFSGTTALTRLPIGPILACPQTRELFCGLVLEAEAVGRACGVKLPHDCVATAEAFEPWATSSLSADLAAGKRLELEALHGTVVRLGHHHRVPTPLSFAVYAALKPYGDGPPGT